MFKNKILISLISIGVLIILAYSFLSGPNFEEKNLKKIETYKESILDMENSPAKNPDGFSFFTPSEKWIIDANFIPKNGSTHFEFNMTDSSKQEAKLAGKITFNYDGKLHGLDVFEEGETYLLPFTDLSNSVSTYGGGRYINIPVKDLVGNNIKIDFNQARNFYCAYSDSYICPIPPAENKLAINVDAGEKVYKK